MRPVDQKPKPVIAYILAGSLIVVPFANLATSIQSRAPLLGNRAGIGILLSGIPAADWAWLTLLFVAGVSLFRTRKTAWILAIVALAGAFVVKTADLLTRGGADLMPSLLVLGLTTGAALAALYYFRFPYIDMREDWTGSNERYSCHIEVQITGAPPVRGVLTDISRKGAHLQCELSREMSRGDRMAVQFPQGGSLDAQVKRKTSAGYGILFTAPRRVRQQVLQPHLDRAKSS